MEVGAWNPWSGDPEVWARDFARCLRFYSLQDLPFWDIGRGGVNRSLVLFCIMCIARIERWEEERK